MSQLHLAGSADSQVEAINHARDLLQGAKLAIAAALRAEASTRRTVQLARAFDDVERTLIDLADL